MCCTGNFAYLQTCLRRAGTESLIWRRCATLCCGSDFPRTSRVLRRAAGREAGRVEGREAGRTPAPGCGPTSAGAGTEAPSRPRSTPGDRPQRQPKPLYTLYTKQMHSGVPPSGCRLNQTFCRVRYANVCEFDGEMKSYKVNFS